MSESPDKSTRCITLRLTLNCDLAEVRPGTLALRGFLAEHGVPGEELVACERGRGLFLIQSLMDSATYLRGQGENCLVMRKSRSPRGDRYPADDPLNLEDLTQRLAENERIITDMAEELCSCYESFSAIFRYSSEQKRAVGLEDFSTQLLTDLLQITGADWHVLRLVPPGGAELRVFAASDPGLLVPPLSISNRAGESIPWEVEAAIKRRDVWFEHKGSFSATDPLAVAKGISTGFIHPIIFGETLIGTLAVGKAGLQNPLTAAKINVVHTFADFLAIQFVNSRIQEERVHALLVARDLEIAKNIQRSLLLKTLPQLPGFSLAGHCESARQVGGDFYDVIKLSDTSLLLVIADVMGKGIPAAMFAAIMRSLVRALPDLARHPSELLARINLLLFDELSEVDMFITAQLAFVDATESRLVAASAGHCPMLMTVGDQVRAISPEGMPLGILPDASFGDEATTLAGNCRLLLYTDGLTEARDAHGELLGQERLVEWLKQTGLGGRTAGQLKEELAAELARFQGNIALNDDQTFLILAR